MYYLNGLEGCGCDGKKLEAAEAMSGMLGMGCGGSCGCKSCKDNHDHDHGMEGLSSDVDRLNAGFWNDRQAFVASCGGDRTRQQQNCIRRKYTQQANRERNQARQQYRASLHGLGSIENYVTLRKLIAVAQQQGSDLKLFLPRINQEEAAGNITPGESSALQLVIENAPTSTNVTAALPPTPVEKQALTQAAKVAGPAGPTGEKEKLSWFDSLTPDQVRSIAETIPMSAVVLQNLSKKRKKKKVDLSKLFAQQQDQPQDRGMSWTNMVMIGIGAVVIGGLVFGGYKKFKKS